MDESFERRRLLRTQGGRSGRHQGLLIPIQVGGHVREVDDLTKSALQLIELLVHDSPFRPRARRSASHPASRNPSQIGVKRT